MFIAAVIIGIRQFSWRSCTVFTQKSASIYHLRLLQRLSICFGEFTKQNPNKVSLLLLYNLWWTSLVLTIKEKNWGRIRTQKLWHA